MTNDIVPQLVAHRGYSSHYPENTLLSLEQAFLAGACFVECDVQLTLDEVPVILHDAELIRTTDVQGNVHTMVCRDVTAKIANYPQRFATEFSRVHIPALSEFVVLMQRWSTRKAFVEIKRSSIRAFGRELVLQKIVNILEMIKHQVIVISFDFEIIRLVQHLHDWCTGWVVEDWNEENLQKMQQLNPDFVFVDHEQLPEDLSVLPKASWHWALYEIDDPQMALSWVNKGASFIETNNIGQMLQSSCFSHSACNDNAIL